jgi:hypothetical protein
VAVAVQSEQDPGTQERKPSKGGREPAFILAAKRTLSPARLANPVMSARRYRRDRRPKLPVYAVHRITF